jgi:hypothetical protein
VTLPTSRSIGTYGAGNPFSVVGFTLSLGVYGWVYGQPVQVVTTEDLGDARSSTAVVESVRSTVLDQQSARSTAQLAESTISTVLAAESARSSTLVEGTTRS